jgi:hypothetical protein
VKHQPPPNGGRNLKFDHVYVVIRMDSHAGDSEPEDHAQFVTSTKAYWSIQAADAEVERLNRLNKDKGCIYFRRVARIERNSNESP